MSMKSLVSVSVIIFAVQHCCNHWWILLLTHNMDFARNSESIKTLVWIRDLLFSHQFVRARRLWGMIEILPKKNASISLSALNWSIDSWTKEGNRMPVFVNFANDELDILNFVEYSRTKALCRESERITLITDAANPDGVNTFVQKKHQFCNKVANAGDTETCNLAAPNRLFSFNWSCNEFELLKKSIASSFRLSGIAWPMLLAIRSIFWYCAGIFWKTLKTCQRPDAGSETSTTKGIALM